MSCSATGSAWSQKGCSSAGIVTFVSAVPVSSSLADLPSRISQPTTGLVADSCCIWSGRQDSNLQRLTGCATRKASTSFATPQKAAPVGLAPTPTNEQFVVISGRSSARSLTHLSLEPERRQRTAGLRESQHPLNQSKLDRIMKSLPYFLLLSGTQPAGSRRWLLHGVLQRDG